MADRGEFARLTGVFRRELLVHCYRMLGSMDEAEDLVQETYLRAWRSYEGFEGRSSLRTWLYRIATNACLTALEQRGRRPLPSGLGGPAGDPHVSPDSARPEIDWLQPLPGRLLDDSRSDPAAIVASRSGLRLALIAALQHLSPLQRAVLILRDVLEWRASEVAELLGTTTAAVKSALQRARARIDEVIPVEDGLPEPAETEVRALLDRYMSAFEDADVTALARLLREDVALEMPPYPTWFAGRDTVAGFFAANLFGACDAVRMVPVTANGQPAVVAYLRGDDGVHRAHAVHVLTATATGISRIVVFLDPGVVAGFGLPHVHPPAMA